MNKSTGGLALFVYLVLLAGASSCGTYSCIARGGRVRTPDGLRNIEDLRVGDAVICVDPESGAQHVSAITQIRSSHRRCLGLQTSSSRIFLTDDHPVYSPEREDYCQAGRWLDGELRELMVVDEHGVLRRESVVERQWLEGLWEVFDISVEHTLHNFVVDGVLVHNKSSCLFDTDCEEGMVCDPGEKCIPEAKRRWTGLRLRDVSSCADAMSKMSIASVVLRRGGEVVGYGLLEDPPEGLTSLRGEDPQVSGEPSCVEIASAAEAFEVGCGEDVRLRIVDGQGQDIQFLRGNMVEVRLAEPGCSNIRYEVYLCATIEGKREYCSYPVGGNTGAAALELQHPNLPDQGEPWEFAL